MNLYREGIGDSEKAACVRQREKVRETVSLYVNDLLLIINDLIIICLL